MKEKSEKSKEKKVVKPVRKVQKLTQLSSLECKAGEFSQYITSILKLHITEMTSTWK